MVSEDVFDELDEEEELKALQEMYGDLFELNKKVDVMIVPENYIKILRAFNILKRVLDNKRAKLDLVLFEPLKTSGFIEIISKDIVFSYDNLSADAVSMADDFEVTPLKNGSIRVMLGFNNIAVAI